VDGRLTGLSAIVTGGGGGLGSSIAIALASEGASVVVNDLGTAASGEGTDPHRAAQVVDQITAAGGTAYADAGDMTDFGAAEKLVRGAIDSFGKLDILVNAIGIIRLGTAFDTTPEDFSSILRVNLEGVFNPTHFAAKHWVERGEYGRLINFASGASIISQPTLLAYSTTKTGIIGFTRACANALGVYNVTANCVRPSAASAMMDATSPEAWELFRTTGKHQSESATGTLLDPAHVTPLVVYLASPSAGHVSGRLLEGRGGKYVLWSEPSEEKVLERDFLQDPDGVFEGLEEMTAGLSLNDLKMPMPPVAQLGDWPSDFGTRIPVWDFDTGDFR
jgi:NAD(P)-dependent dehydrogenase (short-subunit alcohol dehydrogenase family)